MVAKFLDDNKPIKSLKSLFALFQTSLILFNWRNFLRDRIYPYLSLEKESDNFWVVFTYSITRAREIRTFHVVAVQRRQRNAQNGVTHVHSCCLLIQAYYFLPLSLPSLVLLSSRNSATMVTWRHTSPLYCKSLSVYQSIPFRLSFPSWSPESTAATYWEAIMLKFLPVSGLVIFKCSASSFGVTKPSSLVSTSSNKSYELSRI